MTELRVVLDPKANETMKKHMYRYAGSSLPEDQWREAMGVFIGYTKKKVIYVSRAIPLVHGTDVDFEFGPKELVTFDKIDRRAQERGLIIQGWYHSHPGIGIFLSPDDMKNHLVYTTFNPTAIALVFDHTEHREPVSPGFKIFITPEPGSISAYEEVPFEIASVKIKKKKIKGEPPDPFFFLEEFLTELDAITKTKPSIAVKDLADLLGLDVDSVNTLILEAIKDKSLPGTLDKDVLLFNET
ncbi:MAG: Mov34/MPN/PAD-1 family protein [Candidatus Helarchaeota archaeon]